jgi:hypothetical protein
VLTILCAVREANFGQGVCFAIGSVIAVEVVRLTAITGQKVAAVALVSFPTSHQFAEKRVCRILAAPAGDGVSQQAWNIEGEQEEYLTT